MARIINSDKTVMASADDKKGIGGRKLSFKTRGGGTGGPRNCRATKVSVPASSVQEIASKFNAIIVEDETKGRALIKKLQSSKAPPAGSVREAVLKFENVTEKPKMVLVRKNSQPKLKKLNIVKEETEISKIKPEVKPKPELDKSHHLHTRHPLKMNYQEVAKEKRLSIPKNDILDSVLNEGCQNVTPNPSFLWGPKEQKDQDTKAVPTAPKDNKIYKKLEAPIPENEVLPSPTREDKSIIDVFASIAAKENQPTYKEDKENVKSSPERPPAAKSAPERQIPAKDDHIGGRNVDSIGYGKINSQEPKANVSTLYRHLNSSREQITVLQENNSYLHRQISVQTAPSESAYEDISKCNYEEVENSYDVIHYAATDDEVIYDDVLNVNDSQSNNQNEGIYESIYDAGRTGSDISYEQSNSLYEARPSSRASSGSGAIISGASRSDTSDDWVDIELDNSEEQKEEILVLQDTSKPKVACDSWSQKVRKQWNSKLLVENSVAVSSTSFVYFAYDEPELPEEDESPPPARLYTKGLVSLREIYFSGYRYEVQEVTIFLVKEGESDSSGIHYEAVESPYDALYDDFDSSDSEMSVENGYPPTNGIQNIESIEIPPPNHNEGIYGFMRTARKKMRKTSWSFGQRLRRISRISMAVPVPSAAEHIANRGSVDNISRGKWPSFKKKNHPQSNSTFYLDSLTLTSNRLTDGEKDGSRKERAPLPTEPTPLPKPLTVDVRRLSASIRPSSPPPPPPLISNTNGDSKSKPINDTSLYMECGLFENTLISNDRGKSSTNSWYSDVGLYENNKPSDSTSEHDSSNGSDLDLRFANEPLYQFYAASVVELERADAGSEVGYEEIKMNENNLKSDQNRPSALDLVSSERHRTLWSQVPQVINSGILDTLSTEKKRLQEAKFELITSEASYYKSLVVLEKHFAASALLKDESTTPKVDYKTLFGNITPVRKCSEAVLAALEKCWQESILLEGVCDIVCQLTQDKFSCYVKYCKHQIAIERTLKNLKKTNNSFLDALKILESSPKCHSLSLYSFLLLPMQRITRMPLLLDAILTKLVPSDHEYDSCKLALSKLSKVVHDCNEAARQTERLEEMVLLSHSLIFPTHLRRLPLLSESRWLVRSGQVTQINMEPKLTLSKKLTAGRSSNKLTLFLFTDYLILAKKKGDENFTVVTYCARNLVQMTQFDDPIATNKYLIMVTLFENHEGKTQEMVMSCGSESSRERWLHAFTTPKSKDPNEVLYESWDCPQVSVTHAYTSSQPDELTLQPGDVMNVHRKSDGWFYGERTRDREEGWFPGNYTVEIASSHIRARNLKQRHRLLAFSSNFILSKQNKATS